MCVGSQDFLTKKAGKEHVVLKILHVEMHGLCNIHQNKMPVALVMGMQGL
jgi:hypothetical protein